MKCVEYSNKPTAGVQMFHCLWLKVVSLFHLWPQPSVISGTGCVVLCCTSDHTSNYPETPKCVGCISFLINHLQSHFKSCIVYSHVCYPAVIFFPLSQLAHSSFAHAPVVSGKVRNHLQDYVPYFIHGINKMWSAHKQTACKNCKAFFFFSSESSIVKDLFSGTIIMYKATNSQQHNEMMPLVLILPAMLLSVHSIFKPCTAIDRRFASRLLHNIMHRAPSLNKCGIFFSLQHSYPATFMTIRLRGLTTEMVIALIVGELDPNADTAKKF